MTPDTEAQLLLQVGEIHADVKQLLTRASDHDKRLRSLERTRWYMTGAMGVLFFKVSAGLSSMAHLLTYVT